jgi:hypothetical protein
MRLPDKGASKRGAQSSDGGAMLKTIPVDVWVATTIAIADVMAGLYGLGPALFVAMFVAVCGYVLVETFRNESR